MLLPLYTQRGTDEYAFSERFVRSIKDECLDRLILFGEPSLQRAIDNYIEHYHRERPHQGKDNVILFRTNTASDPPGAGRSSVAAGSAVS